MRKKTGFLVVAALFVTFTFISNLQAQPLVNIETVTVGDAGNAPDTAQRSSGYGSVAYGFNIGKYEVTIGQYTSFLNAVAATDTYSLYNPRMAGNLNIAGISRSGAGTLGDAYSYSAIGSANRPISYVSWFDAARFANWMHNGAINGASTETGAYTLNGATTGIITKNAGATWWIPSENEWFKAAYYKGGGTNAGYWLYPTQSDTEPGNTIGGTHEVQFWWSPTPVTLRLTNQANHRPYRGTYAVTQSSDYSEVMNYLTDVGAFSNSASAYGTYDQGGNLLEWSDAVSGSSRGRHGGSWDHDSNYIVASGRLFADPSSAASNLTDGASVGFRLATVPEPSTYALLAMTAAGALWMAKRRR